MNKIINIIIEKLNVAVNNDKYPNAYVESKIVQGLIDDLDRVITLDSRIKAMSAEPRIAQITGKREMTPNELLKKYSEECYKKTNE